MTRHDKLKKFFKENFDLILSDHFKPCIIAYVKNPPIEIDRDDCSKGSCVICKARTWWDEDDEQEVIEDDNSNLDNSSMRSDQSNTEYCSDSCTDKEQQESRECLL